MKTAQTEELDIIIPDYIDRFLSVLAKGTGKTKEDIALFFLLKEAEHACQAKTLNNGKRRI